MMRDLTFSLRDTIRRMYLLRNVRDEYRLYWVGVARPSAAAAAAGMVQVTVMKVVEPSTSVGARWTVDSPGLKFRVRTMNETGWHHSRCKPRPVCWDRTALARAARALDRGADPTTCMTALYSPPWCVTFARHDQRYNAIITWSSK